MSQDVETLAEGTGTYAVYLTPQGRMIADLRIHVTADGVLLDVSPGLGAPLASRFDQLVFTEDVQASDETHAMAHVMIAGGRAAEMVARAFGVDAGALESLAVRHHVPLPVAARSFVARADDAPSNTFDVFDVFMPVDAFDETTRRIAEAGSIEMSEATSEALRIEAARPAFGIDMTDETIPLEAGLLDRAISQTKGCYVGQEIIVRVLHRGGGRVARRLVRIDLDPIVDVVPPAGAVVTVGDRETGRVTSAAFSPSAVRAIALAYVHRDDAVVGRDVHVRVGDDSIHAVVTALAG